MLTFDKPTKEQCLPNLWISHYRRKLWHCYQIAERDNYDDKEQIAIKLVYKLLELTSPNHIYNFQGLTINNILKHESLLETCNNESNDETSKPIKTDSNNQTHIPVHYFCYILT